MILSIFSDLIGDFNSNVNSNFYNAIPLDFIFIFIIIIFVLVTFLIMSVFIFPLFRKSPTKLYDRYLYLRKEMDRIDDIYSKKQILFDDYVSMQLLNAQEYYDVIKVLSKHPEYKSKLQNYSLKKSDIDAKNKAELEKSKKDELKNKIIIKKSFSQEEFDQKQINKLYDVLKNKVEKYSKEDLYSVLLFEGFNHNIINSVLEKLIDSGVVFSKYKTSNENKKDLSLFLDNLLKGSTLSNKDINTSEKINLDEPKKDDFFKTDLDKRKELNFNKISDVDYTFKKEMPVENKEKTNFFKRLFSFKKKPKPTINEIDTILKNIESELKNKEI